MVLDGSRIHAEVDDDDKEEEEIERTAVIQSASPNRKDRIKKEDFQRDGDPIHQDSASSLELNN